MANDLATALIAGQNPGLMADPELAAIAPQLQMGQALSQQGMSTAAAYPAQALGRLGQALAGAYLTHDAQSQLNGLSAGSAESLQKIFKEGTPMGEALRSPSPMVRMMAMREAGKSLVLANQQETLGPNQVRTQPGIAPAGGITAAGSPSQGGAAAGAEAAGAYPYKPVTRIIPGPNGPEKTDLPLVELNPAAGALPITPRAVPTQRVTAPMQPPGPAAVPPDATVIGGPPAAIGLHLPGQASPQPPAAQHPPAQQVAGVRGEPIFKPDIAPLVAADAKEVSTDREAAQKGQQDMATVRAIQDFLPKVKTGWSGETRLEAGRILQSAGVEPKTINDFLKTDVASGQLLQKKFLELSAGAARQMGAREPGSVIQMFGKAYPNLGTDEQAIRLQTNALYMDRMRTQELANQKTNHLVGSANDVQKNGQYAGLKGFNEKFNAEHPAERYFSAAEAMSGVPEPWKRIKDPQEQNAVINLIPKGTQYMSPDGKMRIKP